MRKLISFAAVLVFLTSVATAQDYTFRVLVNKGSNKIQRAGSGAPEALKTGSKLFENDQIIASEGAYIGLMHKSGKTTEIKEQGTKKVSEIAKTINVAGTSITNRYAQFVSNKMNSEETTDYRSRLNATGAVSRAAGSAAINILVPAQVDVMGSTSIIRWEAPEDAADDIVYSVKIKNIFDEVILATETKETFVEIDFTTDEMANDAGLYLVKVYNAADEEIASSEVGIKIADPIDKSEVVANLKALKAEISDDTPLNKIIYASFYEENGLFLDALTKYEEAIAMAPEVEEFQTMYEDFKVAAGLVKAE
ncbi:MAG: hypothetical protein RIA69_15910 [Cyclobacteriaceae bacterium]